MGPQHSAASGAFQAPSHYCRQAPSGRRPRPATTRPLVSPPLGLAYTGEPGTTAASCGLHPCAAVTPGRGLLSCSASQRKADGRSGRTTGRFNGRGCSGAPAPSAGPPAARAVARRAALPWLPVPPLLSRATGPEAPAACPLNREVLAEAWADSV